MLPQSKINQLETQIDAAFNGWLFSATNLFDSINNQGGIEIRKSIDNGLTWNKIDLYLVTNIKYEKLDIVIIGNDTNNLKLYMAAIRHDLKLGTYTLFCDIYNGRTLSYLGSNLNMQKGTNRIYDVAIASDYRLPSVASKPYSIGLIYSCFSSNKDSINYLCSEDGGATFGYKSNIATTSQYFRTVDIAYGKSASGSNGRYFFTWEKLGSSTSRNGNIYTSRNSMRINSMSTNPINLDSISTTMINLCRNPKIATQFSTFDNDSLGVSAVVIVERDFGGTGSDYDILGFYNKRAHFTNFWRRFDVENNSQNFKQADIKFLTDSNTFLLTYFNNSNLKLTYVKNNFNLVNANIWTSINDNYANHGSFLINPNPKLAVNPSNNKAVFAWIQKDTATKNGTAFFDAEYSNIEPIKTAVYAAICAGDSFSYYKKYYKNNVIDLKSDIKAAFNGIDSLQIFNLKINALPIPVIQQNKTQLSTGLFKTYQWQLDNNNLPTAIAQTYNATINGLYKVTVKDSNNCIATSASVNVVSVSIMDANKLKVSIYPNPVSNFLYFNIENVNPINIVIFDIKGKIMFELSVQNRQSIDVSTLPSGNYFLNVKSHQASQTIPFIKN